MGALILAAPQARSQIASSPPPSTVLGSGAVNATDGQYRLQATAGQSAAGLTGSNPQASIGFWIPVSPQTSHYQADRRDSQNRTELHVQASPNPFSDATQVIIRSGNASQSSLVLYDVLGQPVRTLALPDVADDVPTSFTLNAEDLPSGQYTLVFSSGEDQSAIPLRLVK